MPRLAVLLALVACSGPSKVTEVPGPPAPDAAPPTPAELAVADHRDRLFDQRGVVDVRVDDTGVGVIVDVCAAEVAVDLTGLDVPAIALPGDWRETARGQPCGCGDAGIYHDDGAQLVHDCNACTCDAGRLSCTERTCPIVIAERVQFTRNAALLDRAARTTLDPIARRILARPDAKVTIRGHADAKEVSVAKLSKKRAVTVRAYLIDAGVPKAQILPVDAAGADEPLGGPAEADRRVEFVVAKP